MMIKTNLLLVVLASAFVFAGCSKDESAPEEAPKTAEPTSGDTAVVDEPATGEPAATEPGTTEPGTTEPGTTAPGATAPGTAEPAAPAGQAQPAAPTGDPANMGREQIAEQAVAMFTKMNEVVKTGKNDCDKIASEITTVINEYKPVMAAAKKLEESPENKKWFEDTYGEKVTGIMTEMMANMSECVEDPAVQKAFEGMEE